MSTNENGSESYDLWYDRVGVYKSFREHHDYVICSAFRNNMKTYNIIQLKYIMNCDKLIVSITNNSTINTIDKLLHIKIPKNIT